MKYQRNCPVCQGIIEYVSKYSARYAEEKARRCKKCVGESMKGKPPIEALRAMAEIREADPTHYKGSKNPFYGKKHTQETINKQRLARQTLFLDEAQRELVRQSMKRVYAEGRAGLCKHKGKSNHQIWTEKYGKEEADKRWEEFCAKQRKSAKRGKDSHSFGKPAPQGSGNGWKGWYKEHYFRSLRELMCMIDMDAKGLSWKTAETNEYRIEYMFNGGCRTYRPDFVVGNELWELKPKKLHNSPNVVAKHEAAIEFCKKHDLIYRLMDIEIKSPVIKEAYDRSLVRFDRNYEQRFLKYIEENVNKEM
jgi:hypothetical protein